jgi:hypothetical protein
VTKAKPKREVDLTTEMRRAGFSKKAAEAQNKFWASFGIEGVRIGSTRLKVKKEKT